MKVKITLGRTARDARVEIDGEELEGVVRVRVEATCHAPSLVYLQLAPEQVEIVGDVDEEQITKKAGE